MKKIFSILSKYKEKKLFQNYKKLQKNNNIILIDDIKKKIYNKELIKNSFYKKFFFLNKFNFDLSYRQYIYSNLIYMRPNLGFIKSLNKKKHAFLIHPYHLKILIENNISVNIFFSYLKWYFYAFISLINSQIYFVKIITLFFFKNIKIDKESVNFCSFPSNKIENINSRNEFFLNHFIEKFKIKKIYHDNRELLNNTKFNSVSLIQNINHIRLFSLLNLFKFITFNILLVFLSLVLFTFKQDLAIMMKEILKSYLFYIEKKNYSKIYLFNNSDGIYRPLWSYLKNKKITTYYFFLGQSCMPFDDDNPNDIKKFRLNFASNYYGLEFLSWQNYLFWNEFQCLSYKKNLIDKKINFYLDRFVETNYKSISNNYNSKSLSFFDITPYDKIFAIKRLAPTYHNFKNLNIMFNDILEICNDLNIHILYKSKRYKEKIHDIKYQKFLESINKIKNVTVYEEEFSSYSILKSSKIAICSPFTSVGVIANTLKIKTAYYDLSDVNYKEMVAFENLPIIKNKHVLREWIKKNINKYEK